MKKISALIFLLTSFATCALAANENDSIYARLNMIMNNKEAYVDNKELKIQNLKQLLNISNPSPNQQYDIYLKLYKEYEKYVSDSAVYYIRKNVEIARQINNKQYLYESEMLLSVAYTTKGMYIESKLILDSIDTKQLSRDLLPLYYNSYSTFYSHYGQSNDNNTYYRLSEVYRDSLLAAIPPGSLQYKIEYATMILFKRKYEQSEKLLLDLLTQLTDADEKRALVAYLLGHLYKLQGNNDLQKKYLAISAITDVQHCLKDNASMQSLALAYYEEGNIDQAYKFIQAAMDDAVFCNVRYRTVEASISYPIINSSYREIERKQNEELKMYLILISILSTALIIGIIYIYRQVKKLAKIRRQLYHSNKELNRLNADLQSVNDNLHESNHIKEEYIAHFFDLCSNYIDKLESYRKSLNKLASKSQIEDLFKAIKSNTIVENEIEELYKNFDIIFLNLYPTFVEDFNALLVVEERIYPKQGELLNTELRIFALIRLGINDSVKIASFLRYSLRTVYNYRTKVRNKSAVSRDEFEDHVARIGHASTEKEK